MGRIMLYRQGGRLGCSTSEPGGSRGLVEFVIGVSMSYSVADHDLGQELQAHLLRKSAVRPTRELGS